MKGKCYIQGLAAITPQHTFEENLFSQPLVSTGANVFAVTEPDYKTFIPANSLRRISRLLKMGLTTALKCMQDSGLSVPDAIVTGTGKGSLQDTERFFERHSPVRGACAQSNPFYTIHLQCRKWYDSRAAAGYYL